MPKLCSLFQHKNSKNMESKKKITAICFGDKVYKYHIRNVSADIITFEAFIKKKGVKYVNYYDANSKQYLYRKYVN